MKKIVITHHTNGLFGVKFGRAGEVFKTLAEADAFAKQLQEANGGPAVAIIESTAE